MRLVGLFGTDCLFGLAACQRPLSQEYRKKCFSKELRQLKTLRISADGDTWQRAIIARLAFFKLDNISIIRPPKCASSRNEATVVTNNLKLIIGCCIVTSSIGCGLPRPLLAPPGPIRYQQNNASFHDPYADNDAGPEVVGARPRDFQKPAAEPVRSRVFTDRLYGW